MIGVGNAFLICDNNIWPKDRLKRHLLQLPHRIIRLKLNSNLPPWRFKLPHHIGHIQQILVIPFRHPFWLWRLASLYWTKSTSVMSRRETPDRTELRLIACGPPRNQLQMRLHWPCFLRSGIQLRSVSFFKLRIQTPHTSSIQPFPRLVRMISHALVDVSFICKQHIMDRRCAASSTQARL